MSDDPKLSVLDMRVIEYEGGNVGTKDAPKIGYVAALEINRRGNIEVMVFGNGATPEEAYEDLRRRLFLRAVETQIACNAFQSHDRKRRPQVDPHHQGRVSLDPQ